MPRLLAASENDDVGPVGAVEHADLDSGGKAVLTVFVGAASATIVGSG